MRIDVFAFQFVEFVPKYSRERANGGFPRHF